MNSHLPILSAAALPSDPTELVGELSAFLSEQPGSQGYVRAALDDRELFLFVLHGQSFCAGAIEKGRFVACGIDRFLREVDSASHVEFHATDLPLFLCTAVLFRKAPAAQIPHALMDSDTLLRSIKQTGKDAVLVIRRQQSRSLAFCRSGDPVALYPAPGEEFPDDDNIADRIVEYVYSAGSQEDVSIDLYDEIRLPPSKDAGEDLERHFEAQSETELEDPEEERSLIVKLGERMVFRYPLTKKVTTIGRGADNDLPLDNLSVSRHHARAVCQFGEILIEDMGSENGLVFEGERVDYVMLGPGQQVDIGKYTLLVPFLEQAVAMPVAQAPLRRSPMAAVEKTMVLTGMGAVLEHDGRLHAMSGSTIVIGSDPNVTVQIGGMFVAPAHAKITRGQHGGFRIQHIAGLRPVMLNGRRVKDATINFGDEVTIAGERFRLLSP